ncbi:hypothetical protein BDW62DRAFT_214004 [Aspergillus aurantiobrunneus]
MFEIEEIFPTLSNLGRPTLPQLARDLQVGEQALENAYKLGTGYDDLAVILLEPSDKADTHCFDEVFDASTALKTVDTSYGMHLWGQRNIQNTIILDIRAFRSDAIRQRQGASDKLRDDELTYTAFEQILCHLKPRVILVCQCQTNTDEVGNEFARQVCSSIDKATDVMMVKSFRPMYLQYMREAPNNSVTKEVFREITGFGLRNLRYCARNGPASIFTGQGVRISHQWRDESGFARLHRIFSLMFQVQSEREFGLRDGNVVEGKGYQKDDILQRIGPISKLPKGVIPW